MRKFSRLLIFLLAFQMEVRVRAAGDVLQQPTACLKSKESCAIQVTGSAFHLRREELSLHATEDSTIMRLAPKHWRLVKGALWLEKANGVEVESAYVTSKSSQGQYWLIEQGNRIVVRNIDADLEVTLRDGKKLEVPSGFEFWVSGINSNGQSEYGMIRPVEIRDHLPLWNSLYQGSKDSFLKEVQHLRENWGDMAEKSALIYQKTTERKLAAVAEEQRKADEKKREAAAQRQKLKDLYFQRTFER